MLPGALLALNLGMLFPRPKPCVLLIVFLVQTADAPRALSDGGPLAHLVAPPPMVPWEGHHDTPSEPSALAYWRYFYDHSDLPLLTAMGRESQGIREAYLRVLGHWAEGFDSDSVELLAELHHRLRDRDNCYPLESRRSLKSMGAAAPGSVLPAALLHAYALEHQVNHRRFRSFEVNAEHIERLIDLHVDSHDGSHGGSPEAKAKVPVPEWVRQVAFQERIRLALDDGEGDHARRLLDQARDDFPKHVRFLLLDFEIQRGSTGKADPRSRELLQGWAADEGMTERLRYLQVPVAELTATARASRRDPKPRPSVGRLGRRALRPAQPSRHRLLPQPQPRRR